MAAGEMLEPLDVVYFFAVFPHEFDRWAERNTVLLEL